MRCSPFISVSLAFLTCTFDPVLVLSQDQKTEVFLNQGEIGFSPIILEPQRVLINIDDKISFWDIDRSFLLKSYSRGNQFASGMTITEAPYAVSKQGKFFVTYTPDTLFVYEVTTQERIKRIPWKPGLYGNIDFTANEDFLIVNQNTRLTIWDTHTWDSLRLPAVCQSGTTSKVVAGNKILVWDDSIRIISLENKLARVQSLPMDFVPNEIMTERKGVVQSKRSDMLIFYFSNYKETKVWLYDAAGKKVVSSFAVPISATNIYVDHYSDWIVLLPETYSPKSYKPGLRFAAINMVTGEIQDGEFKGVTQELVTSMVFDDIFMKEGHFMFRSSKTDRTNGINLNARKQFTLDHFQNYLLMDIHNNQILFRSKADRTNKVYSVLNTQTLSTRKVAQEGKFMVPHEMSILEKVRLIEARAARQFVLCGIDEDFKTIPLKLIETKSYPIGIIPVGKSGSDFYFKFDLVQIQMVYGANEFLSEDFVSDVTTIFETHKYMSHNILSGSNKFLDSRYYVESKLSHADAIFYGIHKMDDFGDNLDSLYLLDNNTYAPIAWAKDKEIDELFGYNKLSLEGLTQDVYFNKEKSRAMFRINQDLFIVNIIDHHFQKPQKIDLSELNKGAYMGITESRFCNGGENIYITSRGNGDDYLLHILDANTLALKFSFVTPHDLDGFEPIVVNRAGSGFLIKDSKRKVTELHDFTIPSKVIKYGNGTGQVFFSESGKLFGVNESGKLTVFESQTGKVVGKHTWESPQIRIQKIYKDNDLVYIDQSGIPTALNFRQNKSSRFNAGAMEDKSTIQRTFMNDADSLLITTTISQVNIWNMNTRKLFRKIYVIDSTNMFQLSDQGFYSMPRNAINKVVYRKGSTVSTIKQIDVRYNRPSAFIIPTDSSLRQLKTALDAAYFKRLRLNNVPEKQPTTVGDLVCDIGNKKDILSFTENSSVSLQIKLVGKQSIPARLMILINQVPIFGKHGIALRKHWTDTTINIVLTSGQNNFEVYGVDQAGESSNVIPFSMHSSPKTPKPAKTYFVGIGIDHFKNSQYDLKWSVKDIRDLAVALHKKSKDFVLVDTLFNRRVTRENIAGLKQKLLNTSAGDEVIIAYSGHGLLSKSYDYYLSTYAVNFSEPQADGLPYEGLEGLLDGIPARKKLLLIDACHSGEVDKDDLSNMVQVQQELDSTKKGAVAIVEGNKKIGMKNSFELMQELFVQVGDNTGASVISAAGGTQFALERGDLKNGVFTYSLLEAMQKMPSATVSQVMKVVSVRVEELTKGMQRPTFRNETIDFDWEVW